MPGKVEKRQVSYPLVQINATAAGASPSQGDRLAETNGYSPSGNLISKDAVSNYLYNSAHPHAVTRVTTPSGNRSFGYDGNGNLTSITGAGGDHTLTWYSDNQPRKITDAATGELSEFWYDAGRNRWKQVSQSSAGSEIRYYVAGELYEKLFAGGGFTHRYADVGNNPLSATDPSGYLTRPGRGRFRGNAFRIGRPGRCTTKEQRRFRGNVPSARNRICGLDCADREQVGEPWNLAESATVE